MTHLDFVKAFIAAKKAEYERKKLPWKGVHTVISGFNSEFRTLFGSKGMTKEQLQVLPIDALTVLQAAGHVKVVTASRGAMLYLAEDYKEKEEKPKMSADDILRKYGLTPPPVIPPVSQAQQVQQ